jgi:hypothetical protein
MRSKALGNYSPPLPPGEGPQVEPPHYAHGKHVAARFDQHDVLLTTVTERLRAKLRAAE